MQGVTICVYSYKLPYKKTREKEDAAVVKEAN